MENNLLPSGKIRIQKLLPSVKISAKKISADSIKGSNSAFGISAEDLSFIKTKVILIKDLLKQQTLVRKEQAEKLRVQNEKQKFRKREKSLEKKSDEKEEKKSILQAPRIGFLERIKNFISKIILGYFTVKMVPLIPKLLQIVPKIVAVGDFIIDMSGKLLNGFVEFIDWGYKAHDETKKFLKQIGGSGAEKAFDSFNGAVGKVLDAALIVALTMGDMGGGGSGGGRGGRGSEFRDPRRGFKGNQGWNLSWERATNPSRGFSHLNADRDIMKRYFQRYGRDAFVQRFGQEGLERLPGGMARSGLTKAARGAFVGLAGKSGAKAILKFTKPLLKRLPVIGGLIDFGLSVALGESPGRAAFKAIGATLLGSIGAAIGSAFFGVGGIVGGFLGGLGGDFIGGALYDLLFGSKEAKAPKIQGRVEGGAITRGGTPQFSQKRKIKKSKSSRSIKPTIKQLKPGSSVGGENKIEKIFPKSDDPKMMDPLGYMESYYQKSSELPFIGPIFALSTKTLLGDKPNDADYLNIGIGLNSWMKTTFSSEVLRGGMAYAGGGEVNSEMLLAGDDLTKAIAMSIKDAVASKTNETINDLSKQLSLRQPLGPDKTISTETLDSDPVMEGGGTSGQWGPLLDLIAGKESGGNYEAMYPSTTLPGATKMTIAEVARRATGAVGKYQQLPQYLVSRAKAAGLDPNKDLYSPENQDLIISKVNIEGNRGGRRWLRGEISDEQFMQGLSQEFASLPNAQGVFYYPGQRSAMTPDKIKAALSKVKKGGNANIAKGAGGTPDIKLGSGYGSAGSKIAGELGRFIKQKLKSPRDFQAVTEHPEHGGVRGRHASRSYHYEGRALDIGAYTHEQGPILQVISEFSRKKGVRPVELIHGRTDPRGHGDHVHVAFAKGGLVDGVTYAMLGERGREFIIDADSTAAIENTFPGFLSALNKANYEGAINVLKNYAAYEFGSTQEVFVERPEPELIPVNMGGSSGSYAVPVGGGSSDDYAESLAMSQ